MLWESGSISRPRQATWLTSSLTGKGWRREPAGRHRFEPKHPLGQLWASLQLNKSGRVSCKPLFIIVVSLHIPPNPFSSVTGQADLIWHLRIWDLSSIVTLSSTNIENYTWDLCDPDVRASKAKMKWQACGVGGAEWGSVCEGSAWRVQPSRTLCINIFP